MRFDVTLYSADWHTPVISCFAVTRALAEKRKKKRYKDLKNKIKKCRPTVFYWDSRAFIHCQPKNIKKVMLHAEKILLLLHIST